MNAQFLKRMVAAHSWLGLIISSLLFVIFFAGALTLFKEEIKQWAMQPHYEISEGYHLPIGKVIDSVMQSHPFDVQSRATLVMPNKHMPYYRLRAKFINENDQKVSQTLILEPTTARVLGIDDQFFLDVFLYRLHYEFNLSSPGYYLVGIITLIMLFAIVSGIVIHAPKLIGQFFRYQADKDKRRKWLDMHNVVGVTTLPFSLMYALSGLLFNLLIVFEIAFVVALYQGDQDALVKDAGYATIDPQWQDKPMAKTEIDRLHQQINTRYNTQPESIRLYNYGDESAVVHFRGVINSGFAEKFEVAYQLSDNQEILRKDDQNHNAVTRGLNVMAKLHFGNYAGADLRVIYFILAMAFCALIITGNLLWLDKKAKQRKSSPKTVALVTNITTVASAGVVLATAVAFLLERVLPASLPMRSDWVVYAFSTMLLLSAIFMVFETNKKRGLSLQLKLCALLFVALVIIDWLMLGDVLPKLWQQGVVSIYAVEIGMLILALVLNLFANAIGKPADGQNTELKPAPQYDRINNTR